MVFSMVKAQPTVQILFDLYQSKVFHHVLKYILSNLYQGHTY